MISANEGMSFASVEHTSRTKQELATSAPRGAYRYPEAYLEAVSQHQRVTENDSMSEIVLGQSTAIRT